MTKTWTELVVRLLKVGHGRRTVAINVTGPVNGTWSAIALTHHRDADVQGVLDDHAHVLDDHAHEFIGRLSTCASAMAASEAYVGRWLASLDDGKRCGHRHAACAAGASPSGALE